MLNILRRYPEPETTRPSRKQGTADSGPKTRGFILIMLFQIVIMMAQLLFSLPDDLRTRGDVPWAVAAVKPGRGKDAAAY